MKKIKIYTDAPLAEILLERYSCSDYFIDDTYPADVSMVVAEPRFLTDEEVALLENVGRPPHPDHYKMHISKKVQEMVYQNGGISLPALVLDDRQTFEREVISRVRNFIGSPEDN